MTTDRQADRERVAREFVETLLAKEVCLSDAECTIVREAALSLLSAREAAVLDEIGNYARDHDEVATSWWCLQEAQERRP